MRQSTSITGCVRRLVGWVTHSFDDPHVAPYWPTWHCFLFFFKGSSSLITYGFANIGNFLISATRLYIIGYRPLLIHSSVCLLFCQFLHHISRFWRFWPHCFCQSARMVSYITNTAHSHPTEVVAYLALFLVILFFPDTRFILRAQSFVLAMES